MSKYNEHETWFRSANMGEKLILFPPSLTPPRAVTSSYTDWLALQCGRKGKLHHANLLARFPASLSKELPPCPVFAVPEALKEYKGKECCRFRHLPSDLSAKRVVSKDFRSCVNHGLLSSTYKQRHTLLVQRTLNINVLWLHFTIILGPALWYLAE